MEINNNSINVIFTTGNGFKTKILIDKETTVGEMLKQFLTKINKPELINNGDIKFIFNSEILRFDDQKKVKKLFGNIGGFPQILVYDMNQIKG